MDDPTQTSFYIQYSPEEEQVPNKLQDAYIEAYRATWDKCLKQATSVIEALYEPTVSSIVQQVATCYDDLIPGLPYLELPVISINNARSGSLFLSMVLTQLSHSTADGYKVLVTHLYPADAPSLTIGMKTLISGFIENNIRLSGRRKPARSFAAYDINTLHGWYRAVRDEYDSDLKLLAVLHDFEQFDTAVVQDILHICSCNIPQLPFIFMFLLSSPTSPSYIHAAYTRATLTRLRVQPFAIMTGRQILEEVLLKTFFSLNFDPDLMIGPAALTSIIEHYTRHHFSIDTLLTMLQLAHLKYFLTEPLSLLVHPPADLTSNPTYTPILEDLYARINVSRHSSSDSSAAGTTHALTTLSRKRASFLSKTRKLRIGFALLRTIQSFLESSGYKGLGWQTNPKWDGLASVMVDVLRGRMGRDIKTLGILIGKLQPEVVDDLLVSLDTFFASIPTQVCKGEKDARDRLATYRGMDPESLSCEDVGEWLVDYMQDLLQPLEGHDLWDIWYTGMSPFPIELLNPSIRASLLSALLRPHEFSQPIPQPSPLDPMSETPRSPTASEIQTRLEQETENKTPNLWDLPDTSILFSRYLDSGKLINVYDWYESFKAVLDTQREEELASLKTHLSRSPTKGSKKRSRKGKSESPMKKSKGKERASIIDEGMEEMMEGEAEAPDEERWLVEVQARFIRAMHELDYLGFVKHTGRRAEHVVRVVYDVGDEDEE